MVIIIFFALHLSLGGKLDICGRDDLFLLFIVSDPAGLALNCAPLPLPFKFLGTPLDQRYGLQVGEEECKKMRVGMVAKLQSVEIMSVLFIYGFYIVYKFLAPNFCTLIFEMF